MSNVIPIPVKGGAAPTPVRRILMVEDDANDAELLQAYLAQAWRDGAEILHARSLAEGLELQRTREPQLTLLDLDLPDSSGFHTLERMRAAAAGPVVVISGNGHPRLVDEALARGAYDVIPKPELDAATLRRVLRLATLHQEAGRAQRASEGRFRALLENSGEALVLFDAAGRIGYASASMRRVLGYDSAEVLGRNGLAFVHEEDRETVRAAFPRLVANPGSTVTMRVRFAHKDGSPRLLESTLINRLGDGDVAAIVCSFRDLTREEAQRARFDATFENAAVGLAHVDLEGRVLLANRRLCEMLGYARESLVGRVVRELSHPEDADATAAERAQLRAGVIPQFSKRKRYLRQDGSVLWVQLTVAAERDEAGATLYEIAAFEDISETMRAEQRGERLARMYAALGATNEAILKAEDAPTLYRRVCELLVEHGGLQLAAVRLVDPATRWLETAVHAGEPAAYLERARISVDRGLPQAQGPTAEVVLAGRSVVCNDFAADASLAPWHAAARSAGIAAMAGIPLRRAGQAVGVISLYATEPGWFNPELVGLAERMAQNVSFALDSLDRDAALRESESRFRSLTELGSDWFWEQDTEHRFTRFDGGQGNEKWGGDQSQSLGLRRWEIPGVVPLNATWEEHRALLAARQPFRGFEYMRVLPDGSRRYVTASGAPVFDPQGRFAGYRGTAADITQRKAAEQRVRLEHRVAQHLAEAGDAGAGLRAVIRDICQSEGWDCGRFFEADEPAGVLRFREGWGVDDAEVRRFLEASRPMRQARGAGLAGQVWASGEPLWVEDIRQDARVSALGLAINGEMRGAFVFPVRAQQQIVGVLSIAGRKVREPDAALLGTMRSIGNQVGQFLRRQRAEEATRESEARFRSLTAMSSDFYWETDAAHRFTAMGGGSRRSTIAAFGDQSFLGRTRWELPYLKPGEDGWRAHRATLEAHRPFRDFEFSRPGTEGEERFIVVSGEPVFDAQGSFTGYRGVGTDVTERRVAHQVLELEHEVTARLAAAEGAAAGVRAVMQAVCELQDWDHGRYWEADDAQGVLRLGALWRAPGPATDALQETLRGITFRPGEGLAGAVWQSREPLWVAEAGADARAARLAGAAALESAFLVPVLAEGRVLGVVTFASGTIRRPDSRLLNAVGVIGSQLGQFLQRMRGEAALRESEGRFRSLTEMSSDFYWETDAQHRFTLRGSGAKGSAVASFRDSGMLGKTRWELPYLTPDREGWRAHQALLDAHRPFRDFEFSRAGVDGDERFITISGDPVFDALGNFTGYRGVGTDITDRKLAQHTQELEHAVVRHLAGAETAEAGLQAVMRAMCELSGWETGRYWQADAAAGVLRFGSDYAMPGAGDEAARAEARATTFAPGAGLAGRVWQSGEPLWIADAGSDPRVQRDLPAARAGARSVFLFPVRAESRVLGVLAFANPRMRRPDERLLRAVGVIGSQIGQFLSRMRAEQATRESEERFRSLTELSSDYYWESDAEHRLSLRGTGGTTSAQSTFGTWGGIGKRRWELPFHSPDMEGWMAHKALLDAHEPFHGFEFSRPTAEGAERFFSISGGPVYDAEGRFKGYRGVGTDITERKLAERRLRLEHEVVQALAAAEDVRGGLEAAIRAICETEGWDCGRYFEADEQAGVLRFAASWGVDHPEVQRFVAASRTFTHRPGEGVRGIVWQTGEPIWVPDARADARVAPAALAALGEIRGAFVAPVVAGAAVLGVLSISSRVMREPDERLLKAMRVIGSQVGQFLQRKRAEQAMRESEERFRNLTELSSDWYWEQDAAFRFTKVGVERDSPVFGPDAAVLGKARWDLPLTPLSCGWEEHRAGLQAQRTFRDFEYSYAGADGRLRYVSASGYPVRDAEGRFVGYRGIAKDITARYRAREELRLSHERFEIVSRATNDVVWDWNLVTDELWWNDNLCKHYGYAPEEVGALSDSWTSRIHPEDLPRVKAEVEGAIAAGAKSWTGEYRFRRKDGSYAEVLDRGVMMHDAQGRAVRMTGALMDVSDRKLAEGRLRAHAERQAAVARFGQFAIGRRSVDELYTEAARALHCDGMDAVCLLEMHTERREFLVRAAHGEGPHASIGLTGPIAPDSVWPDILRENSPRIAGRKYLAERPLDRPWRAWLRGMGSAVYAPVRDDAGPIAMLCVYAVREHAFGADEVRFAEAVSHVLSTALQRQKAEERLARMAQFDALTGLPNRTLLQDRLGQTIVQSRRRELHAGVLFVDLDRFKLVNDTLGHHQGDALIQQVGQRLLASVRPGDTVGRISGDEFGVVLADLARPDDAALVGQKILEALAVPFDLGGNEAYVTGSIGIAVYPGDGDDAETLLKNADMAMYRAKESARNSYCFFTAEMNQRSVAKVQLNADLRHALERAEFALHYQPKVDLATGALRGLEALLRWNHPARGLVSPAEFVPALEDSGLIVPVGEWVVAEACAQIRRWQAAGLAPVPVAVNLSAKQFLRRDLDGMIQRSLAAAGVPARLIELEITESSLMDNPEEAVRAMNALRAAGLKISVDDFGTGYSSLSYLARFPLSALKIDRAFVRNVHLEGSAAAIVRAVIDMANNLGLLVVAEGVETEQQAAFLRGHGCHQAQGFLYSRPVPPEEIAGRLPRA